MKVSVPPKIEVLTRKKALFNISAEFSQMILGDSSLEKTLRIGILEKEILETISFELRLSESREICAEIDLSIDWKEHKVAVNDTGNSIIVEAGKSVSEQVFESASHISALIEGYRKEYPGAFVTYSFSYKREIRLDTEKHEEARAFLGHRPARPEDNKWHKPSGGHRIAKLTVCPNDLNELSVSVKGVTRSKE